MLLSTHGSDEFLEALLVPVRLVPNDHEECRSAFPLERADDLFDLRAVRLIFSNFVFGPSCPDIVSRIWVSICSGVMPEFSGNWNRTIFISLASFLKAATFIPKSDIE